MHVALVHLRHADTGGTERYLDQLADFLLGAGHEVTVVCRSHAPRSHPRLHFVVLRSPVPGKTLRVLAFARDVERHLARASYDVVLGLGWTWSQDVIRLGGGCLATHRELVLREAQGPWRRRFGSVPLKFRVAEAIERRALSPGRYRHVIVNSEMVRRDAMLRHAIPAARISVVYNGVDLKRFDAARHRDDAARLRTELELTPEHRLLLFVGSSFGRKGLPELIDALPAVAAVRPDVRLLVVGGDSGWRAHVRHARRLGVDGLCRFAGSRGDVEVCHAAADLFVLPTRYDPFANVTLEALAAGLPVVTSPANGAAEILEVGRHGAVLEDLGSETLATSVLGWIDRCRDASVRAACRQLAMRFPAERTASESARILAAATAETARGGGPRKVSCARGEA